MEPRRLGPPPGQAASRKRERARFRLTSVPHFYRHRSMKTIARLPISQLEATDAHVDAFKALAHLTRLQVFFVLVRADKPVSVGEIQEAVGVPGPTLSHHLDLLRRAGLIESRKEERYIYYSVRRDTVTTLVRLLTACC
jgi:ArsR family transcriptional regulator